MSKPHWKNALLIRGFLLGAMYEQGQKLTASRIRRELGVSRATAKRYMRNVEATIAARTNLEPVGADARKPRVVRKPLDQAVGVTA